MSARTRSISASAWAALVEKPPTSISISVTPSLRLEKRLALQRRPAELGRVLLLDVGEVERRRRLVVVEQRARLLAVLPVQPLLDPLADRLQILEVEQGGGVLLDERALRRRSRCARR